MGVLSAPATRAGETDPRGALFVPIGATVENGRAEGGAYQFPPPMVENILATQFAALGPRVLRRRNLRVNLGRNFFDRRTR